MLKGLKVYNFDAAIPGQSLTSPPGSLPMEHPAQFTDVNDALEFLFTKLTLPKQATKLILLLKKGTPVEYIVNTVLFEGVMQGRWTVDVAMLMYQVVFWQVESIAKFKGVKTTLFNDDPQHEDFLSQFVDLLEEKPSTPAPQKQSPFKGLM